jgi:hypothetical protein
MSWENASELVVASDGEVYFAPTGSTLPLPGSDPTAALDPAFTGAGFITQDGASLSVGAEVTDFMAWQSRQPIRREKQTQEIQFSFAFQQWNEQTVPFAFGGGQVIDEGEGLFTYEFPSAEEPLPERSLVVDAQDGDVHMRFVFPRGNVAESVASSFKRSETSQLPITFKVLEPLLGGVPGYFLTDSPAYAAGS